MSTDIMRLPNCTELRNKDLVTLSGQITNWRQCAILGLTPKEVADCRGGSASMKFVRTKLCEMRRKMRAEGWGFPDNPDHTDNPKHRDNPSLSRRYLAAIPPPVDVGHDKLLAEIQQAESTWQAESSRQLRSSWGFRIKAGKASGN